MKNLKKIIYIICIQKKINEDIVYIPLKNGWYSNKFVHIKN